MARHSWLMLLFFLAACFGVAAIGSVWTSSSVNTWYAQLRKPALTPPGWIFAPVWSVLYLSMAMAAWLVWRSAGWSSSRYAMVLFLVQLGLNCTWSGLFFGLRWPAAALADILLLLGAIVATAIGFLPFSRTAFALMIPYALWVAFASYLNFAIWRLNLGLK
ncbi:MAG TPA: TspO/MBR family protein [Candidatus Sulfotelmatobacter sp.]|nr:TspO/MBR family protein [Candidatus Sulfotelmatobacter sp.]